MRWFDPIAERWVDPPRVAVGPLTYAEQQRVGALAREDEARKASAERIWQAVVASATASTIAGRGGDDDQSLLDRT